MMVIIIKKAIISIFLVLMLCLSGVSALAVNVTPDSQSFNGVLPDGTNIYNQAKYRGMLPNGTDIYDQVEYRPGDWRTIFLGYKYIPGYERLKNLSYVYQYARIYGASVYFIKGTSPTYTLQVTRWATKSSTWNLNGALEGQFDVKAVKTKLTVSGGYSSTKTATVEKGETWDCEFSIPGLYNLTWYMRGHSYDVQCGVKILSTGGDDGDFRYFNLGRVIFPTDEIHFNVSKG